MKTNLIYAIIAAVMIAGIFLFPKLIAWIFGICAVVAFGFTWYAAVTVKELPKDLTDDESFDLFNVNRKGKDNG